MERIKNLFFPKRKFCLICGEERRRDSLLCPYCREQFEEVQGIREVGEERQKVYYSMVYNRFFREKYAEYKFQGQNYYDRLFGEYLIKSYKDNGLDVDIVVYIPMHIRAESQRGYNQSALLADCVGRELQLPVLSLLKKTRKTFRQIDMDAVGRRSNVRGSFSVVDGEAVQGRKILVVDDIITTGSTMLEAFRVLEEYEPLSLSGLVLASSKI